MKTWNCVKNGTHPNSFIYWLTKEENTDWWAKIYQRNFGKWQITFGKRGTNEEWRVKREYRSLPNAKTKALKAIFSHIVHAEHHQENND